MDVNHEPLAARRPRAWVDCLAHDTGRDDGASSLRERPADNWQLLFLL